MSRWQGPEHAYSEARRAYEQREEHRHEVWKENNPECDKCSEREHTNKMTDVLDESWCTHCVSEHTFECGVCDEVYPDECLVSVDLTLGEYVCTDCDAKCAADKTRHHAPVEIGVGHLEYILWTMNNMAKDKPYESKPGNAKEWLKEGIDLLKKSMPDAEWWATNDVMGVHKIPCLVCNELFEGLDMDYLQTTVKITDDDESYDHTVRGLVCSTCDTDEYLKEVVEDVGLRKKQEGGE